MTNCPSMSGTEGFLGYRAFSAKSGQSGHKVVTQLEPLRCSYLGEQVSSTGPKLLWVGFSKVQSEFGGRSYQVPLALLPKTHSLKSALFEIHVMF